MKAKKLIEVALPIKEISAESVRDKSLRHGHISTLHLWWARRPLPVCRAIVFASLVPDPLDDNCPQAFKDAVQALLCPKNDSITEMEYRPYADIPYTPIYDPMEDNLRNRLMMFIGKFSPTCQVQMKKGEATPSKEKLSEGSLIKWENKNNPKVLNIARELIWIAYNSEKDINESFESLHIKFSEAFEAISKNEENLYSLKNRHIQNSLVIELQEKLNSAIINFQNNMPSVFDPFAGGGAIPLEAARLGCRSFGNDINPVAHIIEKASVEFPQKFGKPITFSIDEFTRKYQKLGFELYKERYGNISTQDIYISNRLSFDVEFYIRKILFLAESELGSEYPKNEDGDTPIAFYWARTATCSNPACNAQIPLLKHFYLAKTKRRVHLQPIITGKNINFQILEGSYNESEIPAWNNRGNLMCPCCGNITSVKDVKEESRTKGLGKQLIAIIYESKNGKKYKTPTHQEYIAISKKKDVCNRPTEKMERNSNGGDTFTWGISNWGDLYNDRQINMLNKFIEIFNNLKSSLEDSDYNKAIITYISIWIDKIALMNTSYGRWNCAREELEHPFSRQAIAMVFDYPESNPFCSSSGSAINQLEWLTKYIESESKNVFSATFKNISSGEKSQFDTKSITAVITDPPYYDAIAYADISDFFYVWLKRTLGDIYPLNFSTPQTPKMEECTALKHHHNGSISEAKCHFEKKLTEIFDAIELQTSDIVSIMFAHQSTEAWTTLCNSILGARMNITGSWPMDTEMVNRSVGLSGAALESSVTVACRPSERKGFGDYKDVKHDIEKNVVKEVEALYELGFRGADLLTACFGQAVSEFGRYKSVEKADGSEVSVAELLELARNSALDALLKGVQGDDYTKFYIGWLQINGAGESDYDDATKFTRVGVNVDINDIKANRLLIVDGKKIHLAMAEEHIGLSLVEGTRPYDSPITQAHRLILLYREGDRRKILHFVKDIAPVTTSPLWRLMATLKELLPAGKDAADIQGILNDAEDWRQNCNKVTEYHEGNLFETEQ